VRADQTFGQVFAMTRLGTDLYVAGSFQTAGGASANNIARWDGTAWHPLGSGLDRPVLALAVYQGRLIAGGSIRRAGNADVRFVAQWDGTSWSPVGTGFNGVVTALGVHRDTLVAGGYFREAGGVPARHVACWTGAAWDSIGTGLGLYDNENVEALVTFDDQLVVGGWFTDNGLYTSRWKAGLWFPMGSLDGGVHAFAVYQGKLIAGGVFRNDRVSGPNVIASWHE